MKIDGFMRTLEPIANFTAKIGSQRHLAAMRDGFISFIPMVIAGSAALIIKNLPGIVNATLGLDPGLAWPGSVISVCDMVWWGTLAILSLYAVISIAYNLAKSYDANPLAAGFVAFASYCALVPQVFAESWGGFGWGYFNANNLFAAILIALLATELFVRFSRIKTFQIKFPDSVPPAVGRSFSALIPGLFTIFIVAIVGIIFEAIFKMNVFQGIMELFKPLVYAADSLGSALVIVLLTTLLWCFGLHGANIVGGVWESVGLTLLTENTTALGLGQELPHIVSKTFLDVFVHLGGSGATLGLLIAVFIVSRSKLMRTIGGTCIAPGIFNINEPVLFGLPVVLNPIMFIPFICGPLIITVLSYAATAAGFVSRVGILVPWATPPIISGFLATNGDWRACILQIINIAIVTVIYIPFIFAADRIEFAKEQGVKA